KSVQLYSIVRFVHPIVRTCPYTSIIQSSRQSHSIRVWIPRGDFGLFGRSDSRMLLDWGRLCEKQETEGDAVSYRVLMLAWEYPPRIIGGLARVVWALSKELSETGVEVHVVTADHPGTPEYELDGKVHVRRVKTQTDTTPDFITWVSRLNIGLLQYAIKLHLEKPFDVVHAHD